jgi:hypothetical protein
MNQIAALSVATVTILSHSSSEGLRLGRVEEESKASPVILITWRDYVLREKRMAFGPATDIPPTNVRSLELETRGGNGFR